MKTHNSNGFTMTLSTDEFGSIHFNLSEDQGFLATQIADKINKVYRMPRFGITFYGGNNISCIRQQLAALLDHFGEEVSVAGEEFLMEFLDDEENLRHPITTISELVNLN